jgi:hypothetical protein
MGHPREILVFLTLQPPVGYFLSCSYVKTAPKNTPAFLLAVLRAEKLAQPLPDRPRAHELCDPDFQARMGGPTNKKRRYRKEQVELGTTDFRQYYQRANLSTSCTIDAT